MFLGNRQWTRKLIFVVKGMRYNSLSEVTQYLLQGKAAKSFESDLPVFVSH